MLSQKRARDRTAMASRIAELAAVHGFLVEISTGPLNPHRLHVNVQTRRGLDCSMAFESAAEARYRGWGLIAHWHVQTASSARLSPAFALFCGGSVNEIHQCKATTCADDFETFVAILARSFRAIAAGEVWDAQREAWEAANAHRPWEERDGLAYRTFLRTLDPTG